MPEELTPQEKFWLGEFGDEYIGRNRSEILRAANLAFWADVLRRTPGAESFLEFGANIGLNLRAMAELVPGAKLTGVEINVEAAAILKDWGGAEVRVGPIREFVSDKRWDMVFTKGVLIHLHPDSLPETYDLLHKYSSRYILIAEYYNPSPMEVRYRGHCGKLFKRDFAGELLDRHPDLKLVDYRFVWRRDSFPQDDITWFLMEKTPADQTHGAAVRRDG